MSIASAPAQVGSVDPCSGSAYEPPTVSPEFREIYDAHFAFVWRGLARFGVRESDLMDGVQNVFLVVFRRRDQFEGRAAFRTWLLGICRRVASGMRRRAGARVLATDLAEAEAAAPVGSIPESETERRVHARHAQVIVEKLPEEQRIVFLMFELEEMSCADIAEALEIPCGTVHSRLRRAREFFKRECDRLTLIETNRTMDRK